MLCSNVCLSVLLSFRIWWNCRNNNIEKKRDFKLKEDDILRLGKLILPATNLAISKTRELFSGEPSMTLRVIITKNLLFIFWQHTSAWVITSISLILVIGCSIPTLRSWVWPPYNNMAALRNWYVNTQFTSPN